MVLYGPTHVIVTPEDSHYVPVWASEMANEGAATVERSGFWSGGTLSQCL